MSDNSFSYRPVPIEDPAESTPDFESEPATDADEYDTAELTDTAADEDTAPDASDTDEDTADATPAARAKSGVSRVAAKKAIDKYLELSSAPKKQLKLLAATIGAPKPDPAELAATLVSTQRSNLQALSDVTNLSDAFTRSAFEAVILAAGFNRETTKRIWALFTALGVVSGGLPAKELHAATKVAEAVGELTTENLADLDAVRQLARK